eukprot:11690295-Prorocentrum_lima.AAC.1
MGYISAPANHLMTAIVGTLPADEREDAIAEMRHRLHYLIALGQTQMLLEGTGWGQPAVTGAPSSRG